MHPTLRRTLFVFAAALVAAVVLAGPAFAATVGEKAPGFTLTDLDGNTHSLADYRGQVVVLEWINPKCPVSDRHAREQTMVRLAKKHGDVAWLAINSTATGHSNFVPPAAHKEWAGEHGIEYTILYDESGETGHAYGAQTTPHMYIVDESGTLLYNGAIDDDPPGRKARAERTNYVDAGLAAVAAGDAVSPATTKPYGCSVKYQ